VTCHVGVPSCGQRHRNVFIVLLLTCTITNTTVKLFPRLASMRLVSGLFLFPTHPLLYYLSPCVLYPLKPNPVEEDWWKGFIRPVHRPSPRGAVNVKSTTPTHPVDYRAKLTNNFLPAMARTSARSAFDDLLSFSTGVTGSV
jgi:hypothetical protein